jgi:hypothetical protein
LLESGGKLLEIVRHARGERPLLDALDGGDGEGGKQADDHDDDHQFNQREGTAAKVRGVSSAGFSQNFPAGHNKKWECLGGHRRVGCL